LAQQADVLHHNRQHPGQRPHAYRPHEDQSPDGHVDAAQHIQQPAHQQRYRPRQRIVHHIARRQKGDRQRDDGGGERAGKHDSQRDADLREIVAKRPVDEILPDEHAQEIASELLAADDKALPVDAEHAEEEQIVEHQRQRNQRDAAQITVLRGKQCSVLLLQFRH
ncbi:putative ring-infected erythrocyte surface antigen, partial [Corchorus olitorius]